MSSCTFACCWTSFHMKVQSFEPLENCIMCQLAQTHQLSVSTLFFIMYFGLSQKDSTRVAQLKKGGGGGGGRWKFGTVQTADTWSLVSRTSYLIYLISLEIQPWQIQFIASQAAWVPEGHNVSTLVNLCRGRVRGWWNLRLTCWLQITEKMFGAEAHGSGKENLPREES